MKTLIQGVSRSDFYQYKGLLVSSNQNTFVTGGIQGKDAITQGSPVLSLCNKENDPSVYGVVSCNQTEGPINGTIDVDTIGSTAVWVINKDGNLDAGDIICPSGIGGCATKQNSICLTNYSVAKVNMKCDFSPKLTVKKVTTLMSDGTYKLDVYDELVWTDTTHQEYTYDIRYLDENGVEISKEEYELVEGYIAALVACTLF